MKLARQETKRNPEKVETWLNNVADWLTVRFEISNHKAFWRGHHWRKPSNSIRSLLAQSAEYEHWLLESERDALLIGFNIQIPDDQELVYFWWAFHDEFIMYEARYHPPGFPNYVFTVDGGISFTNDVNAIECSLMVE